MVLEIFFQRFNFIALIFLPRFDKFGLVAKKWMLFKTIARQTKGDHQCSPVNGTGEL